MLGLSRQGLQVGGPTASEPLDLLALLAQDKNPRVRMEAVLAAGQIPQMNSIKVVALASEQEMDRSIEYAFT